MPEAKVITVEEAYNETIIALVGNDPDHGWRADDSMKVIDAVVGADAEAEIPKLIAAGKPPTAYSLSATASLLIGRVVNPSQFRQMLEKAPRAKEVKGCKTVLRPQPKGEKASTPVVSGI